MRLGLLVADSLRADALGCAGAATDTGTLDRLAAEGLRMPLAWSSAAWTVPSLAAIVSGQWAHRLGLYRWEQPLPKGTWTLFDAFARAGYEVASFVFDTRYLFSSVPEAGVVGSSQEAAAMLEWISNCRSENLLVLVHWWGTHFPYLDKPMSAGAWHKVSNAVLEALHREPQTVVEKLKGMYARAVNRCSERLVGALIGALREHAADGIGLAVTADHGESWEHASREGAGVFDLHGNHLSEEVLQVPWILWAPGRVRAGMGEGIGSNIDIAPTLCELAGVEAPLGLDGVSWMSTRREWAVAAIGRDYLTNGLVPGSASELWREMAVRNAGWRYSMCLETGERREVELASGARFDGWAVLESEWGRARCAGVEDTALLRTLGYWG